MPSGGRRTGAGRKGYQISEREKRQLLKEARKFAKENGKSIGDVVLEMIYRSKNENIRLAASRLFYDVVCVKDAHKQIEVDVRDNRVAVYLPELKKPTLQEMPNA